MKAYLEKHLTTRWAGRGDICHEEQMDSTNRRAKEMGRSGAPHGSLAVCNVQTAGRGRMQRTWETPAHQALTQTMVLRPKLRLDQAPLITLGAAVASAQAIEDVCPDLHVGIKWPNDGIINGKKVFGILSEMAVVDGKLDFVAPGVGINVNQTSFDGELKEKATSMKLERPAEMGDIDLKALMCAYLTRMEKVVDALEVSGFDGIAQEYLRRSVTLNQKVQVIGAQETFIATAKAIDEEGALIVVDENGTERRVLCGDVSVRGLMGYC